MKPTEEKETKMTTVQGKNVIVTGGANGIGYQYCEQLLKNGAKAVAILDLPTSNGEAAAAKLNEEFGAGHAFFFPSDVTLFAPFEIVFKNAVEALGGLDILINNAGILNDAQWQKMIDINFSALVKTTLLGYDYMGKHKGGKGGIIVNIASILGLVQLGIVPVYVATKHAVLGFTVSLKDSYEKTGVSVRAMCPGVTDTPLITDGANRFLDFIDHDEAVKTLLAFPRQRCEYVATAMIDLIQKGENGSVWVSQTSEPPFEIEVAKYEQIKL